MRAGPARRRGWLVPARSGEPEIMDRTDNPPEAIDAALVDLVWVNRWFGGRRTLLGALRPLFDEADPAEPFEVLDVGAGGADLALALVTEGRRRRLRVRVTAVDRDARTATVARRAAEGASGVRVVHADARALPFAPRSFHVVTASLFLHHFDEEEIGRLLERFGALCRRAVVINDLRRHRAHWLAVHLLGRLTRRNPMFRHDGPLSVLRGFTGDELLDAARRAGLARARVERRWPFRLALIAEPRA